MSRDQSGGDTQAALGAWLAFFDGGSVGNPGPSAGAAILVCPDGQTLHKSRYLAHATNNQAEYAGLHCALQLAHEVGAGDLRIHGDSLLIVNQFTGVWKAKDATLINCLAEAKRLAEPLRILELSWIAREQNARADLEVRRCMAAHAAPSLAASEAIADHSDLPERYRTSKFARINLKETEQLSFQELAAIKVGGMDGFSRKPREALIMELGSEGESALSAIAAALSQGKANIPARLIADNHAKLELTALRWAARGMRPDHAGQKVLIDLELSLNATTSRGRRRS